MSTDVLAGDFRGSSVGGEGVSLRARTRDAIDRLRRRVRGLCLAHGALGVAFGILGAIAVSFVLDFFLVLPFGVRLLFLVGGVVFGLRHADRRIRSWLVRPISDEDVANLLERSRPDLRQTVISAVELTRPGNEAAAWVSRSLIESVVRQAERGIDSLAPGDVVSAGPVRRSALLVGSALVVVLAGAVLDPELSGIWFRRNVLLAAVEWPKTTELVLRSPAMPAVVAVGDPLEIVVEAVRGNPSTVTLRSGDGGRADRVEVLAETTSGAFRKAFENVSRPFQFRVRGGDDEIGPFSVDVKLRPRIDMESIRIWCRYPEHTGIAETPPQDPLRHGNLKVPAGTAVRFRMRTNVPVARVFFVFQASEGEPASGPPAPAAPGGGAGAAGAAMGAAGGPSPSAPEAWPDPGALALETQEVRKGDDGGSGGSARGEPTTQFSGEFTVAASGQYWFQFESADGFRGRRPDRFRVEAVPDRKPVVRILEPDRMSEEVTPEATLEIRVSANDDYGIRGGSVSGLYFPTAESQGTIRSFELSGFGKETGRPAEGAGVSGEGTVRLGVRDLAGQGPGGPPPGSRFQYLATVTDTGGNTGDSPIQVLEIVSAEDFLRSLSDLLMVVRDQLREIRRRQESARKDLGDLEVELGSGKAIGQAESSRLSRHQQDQVRISQALERQVAELDRIRERSVRNKVGDEKWRAWVGSVRTDLSQLALGKSRGVEASLEEIRKAVASSPQEPRVLAPVGAAQVAVEREIDSIILRLSEFGDLNAMIQMLRDLRKRQSDLREETRSRVGGPAKEESEP